jgi:hypothetical protein
MKLELDFAVGQFRVAGVAQDFLHGFGDFAFLSDGKHWEFLEFTDKAIEIPLGFLGVLLRVAFQSHSEQVLEDLPLEASAHWVGRVLGGVLQYVNNLKAACRVMRGMIYGVGHGFSSGRLIRMANSNGRPSRMSYHTRRGNRRRRMCHGRRLMRGLGGL